MNPLFAAAARTPLEAFDGVLRHFLLDRYGQGSEIASRVVQRLLEAANEGDVCVPVADFADQFGAASFASWMDQTPLLQASPSPLVIAAGCVYLRRWYAAEQLIADALAPRAKRVPNGALAGLDDIASTTARFFGLDVSQAEAVARGLGSPLAVVVGGPGTGKTTTVAALLHALDQAHPGPLRVAMAAPTGKAAARLTESLQASASRLGRTDGVPAAITVHRLLQAGIDGRFRRDRFEPLDVDVLVLDEASMIDTELFAAVLDALPAEARLVLLGDPDQLEAVSAGSVLAVLREIASPGRAQSNASALAHCVSTLRVNHRFGGERALPRLVEAIRCGDADAALSLLGTDDSLPALSGIEALDSVLSPFAGPWIELCAEPAMAMRALNGRRILCALREGPRGMVGLNQRVADLLRLTPVSGHPGLWLDGIGMVRRNDASLGIANGEVGVISLAAGGASILLGESREPLPIDRIGAVECGFASTVHRAQGSEFDDVLLVLPEPDHPLLTREWLYTAASRARRTLRIVGEAQSLRMAIGRSGRRHSGLPQLLSVALESAQHGVADEPSVPRTVSIDAFTGRT